MTECAAKGGRLRAHNASIEEKATFRQDNKKFKIKNPNRADNHQRKEVSQPSFYTMNPTLGGTLGPSCPRATQQQVDN